MKVRNGFVSNSSSTAFMFIMKEIDIDKLCTVIENSWAKELYIMGEDYYMEDSVPVQIDSKMVAEAVLGSYDQEKGGGMHSYGEMKKFIPINEVIKDQKESVDHYIERGEHKPDSGYFHSIYLRVVERYEKLIALKAKGFKWVLVVDFGNDGIVDGVVGQTLRGGRDILKDTPSVKIMTEEWS